MGWVDPIPRAGGNLYIGGLYALYKADEMAAAHITHVLSVIDFDMYQLDSSAAFLKTQKFNHMQIRLEDDPNENLLRHFKQMVVFIDEGLNGGGGVFVHCAMGKSRSATAVVAYLMWKFGVGPEEGLRWVCEGRPVCEPNLGFMEQLGVYRRILDARDGVERMVVYEEWEKGRFRGMAHEWEARGLREKL